jgi:hypothetical protein
MKPVLRTSHDPQKIPIAPDPEDFAAVDAEYGPLPHDASEKQATDRYRLAQASKLIRTNSPAIIDRQLAAD